MNAIHAAQIEDAARDGAELNDLHPLDAAELSLANLGYALDGVAGAAARALPQRADRVAELVAQARRAQAELEHLVTHGFELAEREAHDAGACLDFCAACIAERVKARQAAERPLPAGIAPAE